MGSPTKPEAARKCGTSDVERRLDLAAELLARIAVRVASEKSRPSEETADADKAKERVAA